MDAMSPEPSTVGGDQSVEELRRELAEAREQQAATADILRVISSSPMDLQRAFAEIAASSARLCDAHDATIFQVDGDHFRLVANQGPTSTPTTLPIKREAATGRAVLDRRTIHVADMQAEWKEYPFGRENALRLGHRTILTVPLIRGGQAIGVIAIRRTEVRPFSDKQIALLETFADQAVIAIENARLFEAEQASKRQLTEALEQQTATSQVLGIISSSPGELEPVFQTMLENATRLCEASFGVLFRYDGNVFHAAAMQAVEPAFAEHLRRNPPRPDQRNALNRLLQTKQPVYITDVTAEPAYAEREPSRVALVEMAGARTYFVVPMHKDDELIGAIAIYRREVRPFTDKQIELVSNFANQAVIAIENTRLLNELRESLQQQTATADVLKVISRSALDLQRVLDALVESAARLCGANDALIFQVSGDGLRGVAHHGQIPLLGPVGQFTIPLERGSITGRAVIDRRTIDVADILAEADEYPESRTRALQTGYRTALCVPLVHAGEAIGVIFIRRTEARPFTERQIELVNTFADQAVIAIENTRLFNEIAQKSRELEIASQHKSQFVANMSHELRTPLAAMLGYAELLQEGIYGAAPEKFLPILTRIRSNGKHLLGLINTVLDISKIEAGQFKLNLGEYALGSIVETVMVATESLAATKKLAFKTEVAKGLPYGLGDEQRLTQVVLNLVGNAIKFTDTGEVRITAGAANGQFALSVSDTGPGIPAEECERIFEKFRQVDSSNTRAKGGTGLGLAIARQIVEMHGGRIWVESTLGQGSTFRMELPVRAADAPGAA
jgi:signal transduction histidine kinase